MTKTHLLYKKKKYRKPLKFVFDNWKKWLEYNKINLYEIEKYCINIIWKNQPKNNYIYYNY